MSSNPRGLFRAALSTLAPAPSNDADAELLGRYVASRDQDAFAALVRRHGPMVHGVCRRRLGSGPDADDAFQVAFMVLARDAAKVVRRESLPGWLYRVAYLVALKLAGKTARREADPLMDHDAIDRANPQTDADTRELRAVLDEELAALPDRLRSVIVLCGLEERTNTEAAKLLGCPVGTVDSRLSAARKALKARLTHRGLALTGGVTLEVLLRPGPAVALGELIDRTTRAAVAYAAGEAALGTLSTIADGVTPTMGIAKLKLFAVAGMSLALFGTAGLGLMTAPAGQEKAKPKPAAEAKAEPPKKPDAIRVEAELQVKHLDTEADVRGALQSPAAIEPLNGITLMELLDQLHNIYGLNIRLDTAAFKRLGAEAEGGVPVAQLYETKIALPITRGMTAADLLTEAIAQLPGKLAYRVRDRQVLIGPAFVPPTTPGAGDALEPGNIQLQVESRLVTEQVAGDPVSLTIQNQPFTAAVDNLRKLTGANIVLDARCKDQAREQVSGTFDDVRLFTVLTVLSDMTNLKPAYVNNVYYVTTPENAERMQKAFFKDLFGRHDSSAMPTIAVPPGLVTDGYQYFPRTADMKPVNPQTMLGGSGVIPGVTPVPAPAPKPVPPPEKK